MAETTLPSFAPGTLDARIGDPTLAAAVAAALARAADERWSERLYERDTTLWSGDPAVQATIVDRLGWLDAPGALQRQDRRPSRRSATRSADAGFTTAIVAGMGGSSLAPEVLASDVRDTEDWLDAARPRLHRPGRRGGDMDDLDPARDPVHRGVQVRHDDGAPRVPRRRLGPGPRRAMGRSGIHAKTPATSWSPSRTRAGALEAHPPPRRLARGLPQPARRRRALLRPDATWARARRR